MAGAVFHFARVQTLQFLLALVCKTLHSIQNGQGPGLTRYALGQIEANHDETVESFDDMSLASELLRGGELAAHPHS